MLFLKRIRWDQKYSKDVISINFRNKGWEGTFWSWGKINEIWKDSGIHQVCAHCKKSIFDFSTMYAQSKLSLKSNYFIFIQRAQFFFLWPPPLTKFCYPSPPQGTNFPLNFTKRKHFWHIFTHPKFYESGLENLKN